VASGSTSETINYDGPLPVTLGTDINNKTTPTGFFAGLLDEVSLYNRALSAAEILAIYNNGARRKDFTPPSIICPPNVTAQCDTVTNLTVTGRATATDTCDPAPTLTYTDSVVGTPCQTMVVTRTWIATDCAGNTNTCTQTITVQGDTTAPSVACPPNRVVNTDPGNCTAVVAYSVQVTDNCDATPSLSCVPASGASFPIGVTTVVCTAWDNCNNTNTCSFTVTVNELDPPPVLTIHRQGANVLICWPAGCPDYQLETKTVFDSMTAWDPVTEAPVLNGDTFCVPLTIGTENHFFRLRRL
jgi:hypothetical protein